MSTLQVRFSILADHAKECSDCYIWLHAPDDFELELCGVGSDILRTENVGAIERLTALTDKHFEDGLRRIR